MGKQRGIGKPGAYAPGFLLTKAPYSCSIEAYYNCRRDSVRLTDAEWAVLETLWGGERFALGEVASALHESMGWNKNTVYTYLTRMAAKGLVNIDRSHAKPYSAAVTRDDCAGQERRKLLERVYNGSAGELIAAFLRESHISREEAERLRRMLDEMEV